MAAGGLGDLPDLVVVVLDPLQELLRLHDARGAEDRRAGHAHVLDPHHGAAGLRAGPSSRGWCSPPAPPRWSRAAPRSRRRRSLPRTRSGPTTPIGIWATPMKFSQWRLRGPLHVERVVADVGRAASAVIRSSAWRRISAASSAGRSLGSSWKRRSPATSERDQLFARVERAGTGSTGLVLLIRRTLLRSSTASQLRDRFHAEAEHADLELADDALDLARRPARPTRWPPPGTDRPCPTRSAPRAIALAASRPLRMPPLPITVTPGSSAGPPDRLRRRDAPAGEELAELRGRRPAAASIRAQLVPPAAGGVEDADALRRRGPARPRAERPLPTSLATTGTPSSARHLADLRQQPARSRTAPRAGSPPAAGSGGGPGRRPRSSPPPAGTRRRPCRS